MGLLSWFESKAVKNSLAASARAIQENRQVLSTPTQDARALAHAILQAIAGTNPDLVADDPTYGELWHRMAQRFRYADPWQLQDAGGRLMKAAVEHRRQFPAEAQASRLLGGYLNACAMAQSCPNHVADFESLLERYFDLFRDAASVAAWFNTPPEHRPPALGSPALRGTSPIDVKVPEPRQDAAAGLRSSYLGRHG